MRVLALFVALLLSAPTMTAQAPVPAPKTKGRKVLRFLVGPWKDWRFLVAMAPFAVGLSIDGHSTALVQRRRPGAVELNPFLPAHPKPRHMVTFGVVYFVGQTYAAWGIKTLATDPAKPNSLEPYAWAVAYSMALGTVHGLAARSNYRLVTCPSGFYKPPSRPGCVARQ